jgi:hypothetical protein
MITTGQHRVFGEAIAMRPNKAPKKPVDSKEFVREHMRVTMNDFLIMLPMRRSRDSENASLS